MEPMTEPMTASRSIPSEPTAGKIAGVTRLERDKLGLVLAGLADSTAPSTIVRKVGVGYATVASTADTTKRLQRAGTGTDPEPDSHDRCTK
jgi:hypothetical protein